MSGHQHAYNEPDTLEVVRAPKGIKMWSQPSGTQRFAALLLKVTPPLFLGCSSLGVEVESMSTSCFSSDDSSLWSSSLMSLGETFSLEMCVPTLGFFRCRIKVCYLVPGVDVLVSVSCL